MLTEELLQILQCPACNETDLRLEPENLRGDSNLLSGRLCCDSCAAVFPVNDGVPDLIPYQVLTGPEWEVWRQHMDEFQGRRHERNKKPNLLIHKGGGGGPTQEAFLTFMGTNLTGPLLDVGCGPGKFRSRLPESTISYFGLDPVTLPEAVGFPLVRALAEFLPFRDHAFRHLITLASLDHFQDVDRFFREVRRVLHPDGVFHLMQGVHEVTGPRSAIKAAAHYLKEVLESRSSGNDGAAPRHMWNFSTSSLTSLLDRHFDIVNRETYAYKWYAPNKLFFALQPKGGGK